MLRRQPIQCREPPSRVPCGVSISAFDAAITRGGNEPFLSWSGPLGLAHRAVTGVVVRGTVNGRRIGTMHLLETGAGHCRSPSGVRQQGYNLGPLMN